MSGFVGADIEQLDALAVRLDRQAAAYREIASSSTLALMVATWTGADIDRVRSEWNRQSKPAILKVAGELTALAIDVRKQAEQQRTTSASASDSTRSSDQERVPRLEHPTEGPNDIRGLIGGVKEFDGTQLFSIAEVVGPDGVTRLIVTIPGTHGKLEDYWRQDGDGWDQVGGWGSNPGVWLNQHTEIQDKITKALAEALKAYPGGTEMMVVGHSQGGMIAQALADDPQFGIKEVVTIGSPVMTGDHGFGGANITRFEHNSDWVVGATDVMAPIRDELTGHGVVADLMQDVLGLDGPREGAAVTFSGGSYLEGLARSDNGIAHDVGIGDYDWLADRYNESTDPGIVAARERQELFLGGTMVGSGMYPR